MPPIKRRPLVPALTREQCRAVDRYAIEQLGIPGVVLMENAGRNAADLIEGWMRQHVRRHPGKRTDSTGEICIVCGKGNNGGDGFVIARHLANRGYAVSVDLAADPAGLTGDAAVNYEIARRMGIAIRELSFEVALGAAGGRWRSAAVVVDALLGTGFSGEVRDPLAGIIDRINALSEPASSAAVARRGKPAGYPHDEEKKPAPLIVAIDVPSGLDADTGTASGPAIRADRTITFLAAKTGYEKKPARGYLGRVSVVDIGAPVELIIERLGLKIV